MPANSLQLETIDLPLYDKKANRIIRNYTLAAAGSGFIPVPLLSGAGVTAIQILLIRDLCSLFHVPFEGKNLPVIINSIFGTLATQLAEAAITNIPGLSNSMKGFSGAAIASLYTATVGEFYKVHFQNGGNLGNASIADIGKYFMEEYKRGDISLGSISNPIELAKRLVGS